MKKIILGCAALLAACTHNNPDGTYVTQWRHEYSVANDTLEIRDGIVTKRTGFQRIRNGELKAREYKVTRWRLNEPGSVVITFAGDGLVYGTTAYQKLGSQ